MLDIILPLQLSNLDLAIDAIGCIERSTDFPFKLTVIVDGGLREDIVQVESFLAGYDKPWRLLHNAKAVGLNQTLREAIECCTEKLTAIIMPTVRINDAKWFGKVQMVFSRDPIAAIIDTTKDTKSSTLHPVKRAHNKPVDPGCHFAVLQTAFAKKVQPYGDVDPFTYWSRQALSGGGSSWAAPGVSYYEIESEEHKLWHAPLAPPSRSASQSPTTQD